VRPAVAQIGPETGETQCVVGARREIGFTIEPRHECHVATYAPVREEAAFLRHIADRPAQRHWIVLAHVAAAEGDPPAVELLEAIDAAEQGALPRAALADEGERLGRIERE
jgi:hypothetical protein